MSKELLVKTVKNEVGLTEKQAAEAVNAVLETIEKGIVEKGIFRILGFGTFEVRSRAARKGRNPQTGEEITIAATRVPAFKPSKNLKEAVK